MLAGFPCVSAAGFWPWVRCCRSQISRVKPCMPCPTAGQAFVSTAHTRYHTIRRVYRVV